MEHAARLFEWVDRSDYGLAAVGAVLVVVVVVLTLLAKGHDDREREREEQDETFERWRRKR